MKNHLQCYVSQLCEANVPHQVPLHLKTEDPPPKYEPPPFWLSFWAYVPLVSDYNLDLVFLPHQLNRSHRLVTSQKTNDPVNWPGS